MEKLSLLFPKDMEPNVKVLSEETMHDLGVETFVAGLSSREVEKSLLTKMLSRLPIDKKAISYRADIFEDMMNFAQLRDDLQKLLQKVDFLKNYGSFGKGSDVAGIWQLMHRMDEMNEYILCVEAIYNCLKDLPIQSEGLKWLRDYCKERYLDRGFAELKKDIEMLRAETSNIKSVTLGINLNERFEANAIGLISINNKYFTRSDLISHFADFLSRKDDIQDGTEWKEDYSFRQDGMGKDDGVALETVGLRFATHGLSMLAENDVGVDTMQYMDRIANHMLSRTAKHVKDVISHHINADIHEITDLIPEFMFYIRWVEFIQKMQNLNLSFVKPECVEAKEEEIMCAKGIYNLKLSQAAISEPSRAKEIVVNDLEFDKEHMIYILTGANRGGKTTITQAVGIAFLLAQHGIYVPGTQFRFTPCDAIFTHFPADEDKTMDLGRLGEECQRFRDAYKEATQKSLLLLNETFSTTSYEEGYYIAVDAVKALRHKGIRTIYNTHMHKLGMELDRLNEGEGNGQVSSLTMLSEGGKRSYVVKVCPPEGTSYARDIAEKYGVTYEMLMQ